MSTLNSYSYGLGNATWLDTGGFANTNSPLDPFVGSNGALPEIDPAFNNSYDFPMTALLGMVTEVNANYNYLKDGTLLPQGAPVQRHFALDWYEFYAQDSWRMKPNVMK